MSPLLLFPRSVKIKFGPLNTWQLFQHCCTRPETCVQTHSGLHSGLVGKAWSKQEVCVEMHHFFNQLPIAKKKDSKRNSEHFF